jgi:outer membrane receptor for ferrienterochelin and colicin
LIPGVQGTSEGKSDLTVRGGSPAQNLILLDGVPIYNPNHVFGFLSIFNTEALKNVTLYKSSFPARFGGRLSSVIDITTRDGNQQRFAGSVTAGLPTVAINLEGPIVRDRTSFTFSARRTYLDLLMGAINDRLDDDSRSRANFFFHDINAKIHHRIDHNTSLRLSVYNGNDRLTQTTAEDDNASHLLQASEERLDWGTTIVSGQLNRVFTPNLFLRAMLAYNQYHYRVEADYEYVSGFTGQGEQTTTRNFLFSSGIRDYSASADFEFYPAPNRTVRFGTVFTFHDFNPEAISLSVTADTEQVSNNNPQNTFARQWALYAEDEWDISRRMRLNAGLRFSLFNVDRTTYTALDPRLSFRYMFTDRMSLQASYTMMQQYVHLLSSNSLVLQTDLWVPVTGNVKPMRSNQYAIGMFYELPGSVVLSLEPYYKDMRNIIDYQGGISHTAESTGWESKVEAGIGRSYGVEFSLERREGRVAGMASYTWSKSERKFDDINFGEWFPSQFDRRHAINLSLNYQLNTRFNIAAAWIYHTGNWVTLPMMTFVPPDVPNAGFHPDSENVLQLERRNNFRMADHHRLDVGVNYRFRQREYSYNMLSLSVYNVYNRMNAFRMAVDTEWSHNQEGDVVFVRSLRQVTLFPIIPALSFTRRF